MGREIRELVPEGVGNFILHSFHEVKQMAVKQTGSEDGAGNFIVEKWQQFHILPPGARSETLLHHVLVVGFLVLFTAVILVITVPFLVYILKCFCVFFINLMMGVLAVIFASLACICSCFVGVITGLISTVVKGFVVCLRRFYPCFFSSGAKMMRAPGRPGVWIPRPSFESNPAEYFRLLHAGV